MRYILLLLILANYLCVNAQISDSFYNRIPNEFKPKNKQHITFDENIDLLHKIKYDVCIQYQDEISTLCDNLRKHLQQTKNPDEIIRISAALGCYASKMEEDAYNQEAKKYYNTVLLLAKDKEIYYNDLIEAYSKLSDIYEFENKIDSSLEILSAFKQFIKKDDTTSLLQLYFTYEKIYTMLDQHQLAIDCEQFCIQLYYNKSPILDDYMASMISIARSFTLLYRDTKNNLYKDSARHYLNTVLNYENKNKKIWIPICSFYKGKLLFYEGNYHEAVEQFNRFDSCRVQGDDNYFYGTDEHNNIYRLLAKVRLGDESAIQQLENTPVSFGLLELSALVNNELYTYWQQHQNWKKAFKYLNNYKQNTDSLDILNNRNKFFELNQKYIVAEKEAAINALQIINLKRSRLLLIATAIMLLLIGGFVVYLRFSKLKNKRKAAIAELNRQQLLNKINSIELTHTSEIAQLQKEKEKEILSQKLEISQNIHDEISNGIAALRYYIADIKLAADDAKIQFLLADIEEEANSLYIHTRDFMNDLRGTGIDKGQHISMFLDSLSAKFSADSKLQIRIDANNEDIDLYLIGKYQREFYYILKEAIVNCIKHAHASEITVRIAFTENICNFAVVDNGTGFDNSKSGTGMGIQNMKDRIMDLNGKLEILSSGNGSTVKGSFPYYN